MIDGLSARYNLMDKVDSHIVSNLEWGATLYLSHSKYGLCKDDNIANALEAKREELAIGNPHFFPKQFFHLAKWGVSWYTEANEGGEGYDRKRTPSLEKDTAMGGRRRDAAFGAGPHYGLFRELSFGILSVR